MINSKIKMIAMDLDGTLLDTQKKLSDFSRSVLEEAIDRGITVLASTGRAESGLPDFIRNFPGMRYAVTSNGARVLDLQERKVLYEAKLTYEESKDLVEIITDYDAMLEIYYDGVGYAPARELARIERYLTSPPMRTYMRTTRIPVDDVKALFYEKQKPLDKVQGLFVDWDENRAARKRIAEIHPDVAVTGALNNNIEANAKNAKKGLALIALAEMLGIAPEEVMAFGDGSNDIDMLKRAGVGVAMDNSQESVKEAADYITDSNDEDGVAKAIRKLVLD